MSIGVVVHEERHNSNIIVQSAVTRSTVHRVEFSSKRLQRHHGDGQSQSTANIDQQLRSGT